MKLVVITPSKDVEDEPMLVTKMFESGLTTLHLRKPTHSTAEMREYISQIPEPFHKRIIIHSHHDLAVKFNLKGIHLSRTHLAKGWRSWIRNFRLRFRNALKTRSYRRLQQAYTVEERDYAYYLIGTMFNNMTGNLYSGYYEDGVIAANKTSGKKLVARGGTTIKSIEKAHRYGFYGIALNSCIWSSPDPVQAFHDALDEFRRLGIPHD
jgi:thiamine-phosphate pyrophosphorylase